MPFLVDVDSTAYVASSGRALVTLTMAINFRGLDRDIALIRESKEKRALLLKPERRELEPAFFDEPRPLVSQVSRLCARGARLARNALPRKFSFYQGDI